MSYPMKSLLPPPKIVLFLPCNFQLLALLRKYKQQYSQSFSYLWTIHVFKFTRELRN